LARVQAANEKSQQEKGGENGLDKLVE